MRMSRSHAGGPLSKQHVVADDHAGGKERQEIVATSILSGAELPPAGSQPSWTEPEERGSSRREDLLRLAAYPRTRRRRWGRRARTNLGPTLIEWVALRRGAHTTSDHPSLYRPADEAEQSPLRDPIERRRRHLVVLGESDGECHTALEIDEC